MWIFEFDLVDRIDAEVHVQRLIAHDVLDLLCSADHLVSTAEGQEEHKACVKPDAFKEDRKSTRLNSSHVATSYAVFCVKKQKKAFTIRLWPSSRGDSDDGSVELLAR